MKTFIIVLIMAVFCGCGNYVGWDTDPELDIEEYWLRLDRTVYTELSNQEIIDIVDSVMYDFDDSWPGDLPNDCYERSGWYDIYFLDDIEQFCPPDVPNCLGVINPNTWTIHVKAGRDLLSQYETLGHEFVHHVVRCLYKDPDSKHERRDLWSRHDDENSLEALIAERLWEETRNAR